MRSRLSRCSTVVLVWLCSSVAASAQEAQAPVAAPSATPQIVRQPAPPQPTPRHTGVKALVKELGEDVKHLPSRENLFWAGVGAGLALAAHPFDDDVNRAMTGRAGLKSVFKAGAHVGQFPTLLGSAAAVYAVGRVKDEPKVSHVGMDLIRALLISEGLTQAVKYSVRRERPDHSGRNSFPSGHAADTFAFATALERHLNWRFFVPAYAIASYVAISRLPENRHWLSDTLFGTSVGIIAGRTVTGHETSHYPVAVTPVPGGVALVFVHEGR